MADEYDPAYPTYDTESVDCASKSKVHEENENVMKPEKVKSRWRRSSELECGEIIIRSPETMDICDQEIPILTESTLMVPDQKDAFQSASDESHIDHHSDDSNFSNQEIKGKIPNYDALEENLYRFERKRTKRKKEVRRMLCDCTLTRDERNNGARGCEEDCLNRLLMIECGSRCATGEACSNKRFQKRLYASTRPYKTEKKGWGLKLLENIPAGNFVIEYCGEVLSRHEFKQRVKQYAREKSNHYYFMALKSDEIIDATNMGNLSRFVNHSCDPNCETQKWTVNGELRIGFFAKRDLKAGEELTFDYQFQRYGREAQKCYCESELCSGYIGVSKQIQLDVNTSKTSLKRKKAAEEKKREVLEDLMLEEEIEKLCEIGGLRNREETLVLARLMVRAEDIHSRHKVLDIILGTSELACLRLFLDYHGMSLLWSWMVDVTDVKLKAKILQVLSLLPVPNKTMLLDSKVFSVVQRWASEMSAQKPLVETEHSTETSGSSNLPAYSNHNNGQILKKIKLSDTSDSETDGATCSQMLETCGLSHASLPELNQSDSEVSKLSSNNSSESENNLSNLLKSDVDLTSKPDISAALDVEDISKVPRSDEESGDTLDDDTNNKINCDVLSLACNLLESWKDLKEVFRIPRLEQQKRWEDEREADRHGQQHEIYKHYSGQGITSCKHGEPKTHHTSRDYAQFTKEKKQHEKEREMLLHLQEKPALDRRAVLTNFEEYKGPPRKVLLPTPPRLSKEERRHLFAMEVKQRDHEEALRRKQESAQTESCSTTGSKSISYDQYYYGSTSYGNTYNTNITHSPQMSIGCSPGHRSHRKVAKSRKGHRRQAKVKKLAECQLSVPSSSLPSVIPPEQFSSSNDYNIGPRQPTRPALLRTPGSVDHDSLPEAASAAMYPPKVLYHTPAAEIPFLGAPAPSLSPPQGTSVSIAPCQSGHLGVNHLPSHPALIGVSGMNSTPTVPPPTVAGTEPSVSPSNPLIAAGLISTAQTITCQTAVTTSTVGPGYLPNHGQFVSNQSQPVYYVQPNYTSLTAEQVPSLQQPVAPSSGINGEGPLSPKFNATKMPPNWKTAADPEGNIYYYHVITRQTQWDPPEFDEIGEDVDSGTPTYDEPKEHKNETHSLRSYKKLSKKRSTTTAPADTSCNPITTEIAKKIKELFRTKMSSFIVQCLNPYRKPDCAVGRITSTEDFKHLARKLTHFVMAKELKHCKSVEELECNENVKHKAKDFIQKYMSKYGSFYRKEKNSPTVGD